MTLDDVKRSTGSTTASRNLILGIAGGYPAGVPRRHEEGLSARCPRRRGFQPAHQPPAPIENNRAP